MIKLNSNILNQFAQKGLSINEGIAIDARLVQSASRPISNDDIHKQRKKRNSPEGHIDKNRNPIKFQRDLESDWVVQNDTPHYGLKEHASVDVNNYFVWPPRSRRLLITTLPICLIVPSIAFIPTKNSKKYIPIIGMIRFL
jgi:hypothetical protein